MDNNDDDNNKHDNYNDNDNDNDMRDDEYNNDDDNNSARVSEVSETRSGLYRSKLALYKTIPTIKGDPFKAIKDGDIPLLANIMRQPSFNINITRYPSGWTLLHRAAEIGQTDICEILIEHGAKVNQRTTWGWFTPLALALSNGYTETARSLLHRGADPDIPTKQGKSPFDYGSERGHENLIKEFKLKMDRFLQALRHEKRLERLRRNKISMQATENQNDNQNDNDIT